MSALVYFSGTQSYSINASANTVNLSASGITNTQPTNTTGTLRLELWLTTVPWNTTGPNSGWEIATSQLTGSSNGSLGPNQSFSSINGTAPNLGMPGAGSYYVTLALGEQSGTNQNIDGGFFIDSAYSFSNYLVISSNGSVSQGGSIPTLVPPMLSVSSATADFQSNHVEGALAISDSAANVSANFAFLDSLGAINKIASIALTDGGVPNLTMTAAQYYLPITGTQNAVKAITGPYTATITDATANGALGAYNLSGLPQITLINVIDSSANVTGFLSNLLSVANQGKLGTISFTDTTTPTLTISAAISTADTAVFSHMTGDYYLNITTYTSNIFGTTVLDGVAAHASTAIFYVPSSQATFTSPGTGTSINVSEINGFNTILFQLNNMTALQFTDLTLFVASQTPAVSGGISSAQVANLYGAAFNRTPDALGLAYYENKAITNPGLPITTYAQWFLSSPEYTNAHAYAQSSAGDAQFVSDTYNNLLHRGPETGAVAWYQANVINPGLVGLTPGTAAYATAELQNHATVLADFSQSAEFLGDVQITLATPASAQHWLLLI